ncbi:MAG: hypothetical protein Tsb0014_08440 [Pleurocapsa sp.]
MTSNQLWTQTAFPNGGNEAYDYFGEALIAGDFDGDGKDDLAIGTPSEDYDNETNRGKVNILHGSYWGLTSSGSELWNQDDLSGSTTESYDYFGKSLASADFDGDGYDDLAIGAPNEDIGSITDSGAVNVAYGSSSGLTGTGSDFWTQTYFPSGSDEAYDRFGESLATGDFDGDGYYDLAIGASAEDLDGKTDAGKVNVLHGSTWGLTSSGSQLWEQDKLSGSSNEAYDYFGKSLAAADFDGDGYDDLAIGAYKEDIGSITDSGAVNVAYGSSSGLTSTGSDFWTQTYFPSGSDEAYDRFGETLATGDFDGDGYYDLAIGAPGEDIDGKSDVGKVNVLHGSYWGLTSSGSQLWTQDKLTGSSNEAGDYFGDALAVGDFDGDGYDDLAVGASYEDYGSITNAGSVNVIYGSGSGLTTTGNQFWTQESWGVEGVAESWDRFGSSLTAKDFNGDGYDDLAIGVASEDIGSTTNSGAVQILYGSDNGLVV